jgi:hypothetical protein
MLSEFKLWIRNNTGVRRDFLAPHIKRRQWFRVLFILVVVALLTVIWHQNNEIESLKNSTVSASENKALKVT